MTVSTYFSAPHSLHGKRWSTEEMYEKIKIKAKHKQMNVATSRQNVVTHTQWMYIKNDGTYIKRVSYSYDNIYHPYICLCIIPICVCVCVCWAISFYIYIYGYIWHHASQNNVGTAARRQCAVAHGNSEWTTMPSDYTYTFETIKLKNILRINIK